MLNKILVASDLSDRSLFALKRALRLADAHQAELQVLHVVDEALPGPVAREVRSSAEEYLKSIVAELDRGIADRLRVDVRFGVIWKTILESADRTKAELIVLGSHRFRGIAELFHGTTLERVARLAKVPVLMVPNEPISDYQSVVVGVDFSPASSAAIQTAGMLSPKSRIALVSSYHIPFRAFIDRAEPGDEDIQAEKQKIERDLKKRMSEYTKPLVDAKRFNLSFVEGGAAQALLATADRKEADLICVGSHGRSWLARAFLGSTAEDLLHGASCDVLVAKT